MIHGFHFKDGVYFRRNKDASVSILIAKDGKADAEIEREITIDKDSWASIISSVSELGEEVMFSIACAFHGDG